MATDSAHPPRIGTQRRAFQKRKYVTQVTYGLGGASYIGSNDAHVGSHVMTSDYTGIVFFAVLGMLIVLSTVYIPA